ncbi:MULTISPECIES: hypothetical protein [Photobacterium]|uniref:hypothetical protein n=1 Tax=Photobacterium TaxID=657 RepID=UPI0013C37428|nr:hypothetical protein [Photobacterium swingsii]
MPLIPLFMVLGGSGLFAAGFWAGGGVSKMTKVIFMLALAMYLYSNYGGKH